MDEEQIIDNTIDNGINNNVIIDYCFIFIGAYLIIKFIHDYKEMKNNIHLHIQNILTSILFVMCVIGARMAAMSIPKCTGY